MIVEFVVFVRLVSEVMLVSAGRVLVMFDSEVLKEDALMSSVAFVSTVALIADVVFVSTVLFVSAVAFLFFMNNRTRSPFWRRSSAPFSICMLLPLGVEMIAKSPAPAEIFMPRLPGENEAGCTAAGCPQPDGPHSGPSAVKMVLKSKMNANRYTIRSLPTAFKEGLTFKKVSWWAGSVNLPEFWMDGGTGQPP